MEPELSSIKLDMVTDTTSIVEIVYRAPKSFQGIELMGVDAGLSWLKGKSISLRMQPSEDPDNANYVGYLEVVDSCEFRARGYDSEGDRWEPGLANHRIERTEKGTIEFKTELDRDLFYFKGELPTDFEPSIDKATYRLEHIEEEDVPLFQALIDLSIWIDLVYAEPLEESRIYPISGIMRHLKRKSRQRESKKIDEVVLPIISALFNIYRTALEHAEDDIRYLTGEWQSQGYIDLIKELPGKVKELEDDPGLGLGKDSGDRFMDLLKFIS